MLYLQIASPKSSVLNFLDSNSFEVIISIFQRTEKVPDMERLRKLVHLLRLNKESLGHRLLRTISTFILIDFSWIFFRANGFKESLRIIKSIFVKNPWILFDGSLYSCGLDYKNFHLMLISILILVFADYCKTRGIRIRDVIIKQDYWFRWLFISISIVVILTFGIWGPNYNEANFIYFQF